MVRGVAVVLECACRAIAATALSPGNRVTDLETVPPAQKWCRRYALPPHSITGALLRLRFLGRDYDLAVLDFDSFEAADRSGIGGIVLSVLGEVRLP
jgi:hypothetical protein